MYAKSIAVRVDGVVAQLAERLVRNEKVAGSIPVGSTIKSRGIIDLQSSEAVANYSLAFHARVRAVDRKAFG